VQHAHRHCSYSCTLTLLTCSGAQTSALCKSSCKPQVLAADSVSLPQEPRDTGTVFGTLQLPPQTVYRYHGSRALHLVSLHSQFSSLWWRPERASRRMCRYTFRTRGQRAHLVVIAKGGKVTTPQYGRHLYACPPSPGAMAHGDGYALPMLGRRMTCRCT
jgi:hypothetical protein